MKRIRTLNLPQQSSDQTVVSVRRLNLSTSEASSVPIKQAVSTPKSPRVLQIPAQSKLSDLDPYVEAATKINSNVAADPYFKTCIASLCASKPLDWIKWAENSLTPVRSSTDALTEINKRFSLINAAKWINEAIEESSKDKPGFFARKKNLPAYYDAMLLKSRSELEALVSYIKGVRIPVEECQSKLIVETISFQVYTANLSDNNDQLIASNRLKTLVSARQTVEIFLQTCSNTLASVIKQIQDIDHVRDVTIPAWKIAYSI